MSDTVTRRRVDHHYTRRWFHAAARTSTGSLEARQQAAAGRHAQRNSKFRTRLGGVRPFGPRAIAECTSLQRAGPDTTWRCAIGRGNLPARPDGQIYLSAHWPRRRMTPTPGTKRDKASIRGRCWGNGQHGRWTPVARHLRGFRRVRKPTVTPIAQPLCTRVP